MRSLSSCQLERLAPAGVGGQLDQPSEPMVHRRAADAEARRQGIEIGVRLAPPLRSRLAQPIGQALELAIGLQAADRLQLPVGGAHRARRGSPPRR